MFKNTNHYILSYLLSLFIISFILISCNDKKTPEAVNGVIDLTNIDILNVSPIEIKGEWLVKEDVFFDNYENFLESDYATINIPSSIGNNYAASYYVKIIVSDNLIGKTLMIKNFDINTAGKFFVNNTEIFSVGSPSLTKDKSTASYYREKKSFKVNNNEIHLLIHFSNYEILNGGINKPPVIGNPDTIEKNDSIQLFLNIFIIGTITIMGFYHLVLFFIRRKNYTALFFSILSLAVIIRTLLLETYLYYIFKDNYILLVKIEYSTFFSIVSSFLFFVYHLYPKDFSIKLIRYIGYILITFIVLTLFLPLYVGTYLNLVNQLITLFAIIYVFYGIFRALKKNRDDIYIFIISITLILLTTINDILYFLRVIETTQLAHYGMFLFILFQAAVLSLRFSRAFTENELLRYNLEEIVDERTKELQEKTNELKNINDKNREDLMVAQKIQKRLIPVNFDNTNLKISSLYKPMENLGGDLFDLYEINKNKTAGVILDVCGHGIPAALITIMAKVLFSYAVKVYDSPSDIIGYINNELIETTGNSGDYLTSFFFIIEFPSNKNDKILMKYCNAGHNDIYVQNENNQLNSLSINNPIVGAVKDISFETKEVFITNNDRIFLYTDGLIEAMNNKNETFGSESLKELIISNRSISSEKLINIIDNSIISFTESEVNTDDIAIMIIDIIKN